MDICKIIESCKSSGVSEFIFDTLHIRFGPQARVLKAPKASKPGVEAQRPTKEDSNLIAMRERVAKEEDDSAFMVFENPLEMEMQIARGDLIDAKTGPSKTS